MFLITLILLFSGCVTTPGYKPPVDNPPIDLYEPLNAGISVFKESKSIQICNYNDYDWEYLEIVVNGQYSFITDLPLWQGSFSVTPVNFKNQSGKNLRDEVVEKGLVYYSIKVIVKPDKHSNFTLTKLFKK